MTRFKDYDVAAEAEIDKREAFEFKLGGTTFLAPPSPEAREMLVFLRKTASENTADVADGIEALIGEHLSRHILVTADRPRMEWDALRLLCNDLAVYYGGGTVGLPKAVAEQALIESPPTVEEILTNGSAHTSDSLPDGETLSETEEPPTV